MGYIVLGVVVLVMVTLINLEHVSDHSSGRSWSRSGGSGSGSWSSGGGGHK
ncbi:MAG: hypothetical protein PHI64_07760 [Zoogloea sp.]|uniref:hypothetical protein n=1 Tax=Zoogloea sp. TaxID=49181 RepID=UPI0026210CF7|nr:hypothetical protein [Zoogloea sp.]MDD2988843.1 hypothetical protein [Zoogloea sp.]